MINFKLIKNCFINLEKICLIETDMKKNFCYFENSMIISRKFWKIYKKLWKDFSETLS